MDWIKENKFLSGYIATLVVGTIALLVLLVSARSGFNASLTKFEETRAAVKNLRSKKLFPKPETLRMVEAEAEQYAEAVDSLHDELLAYQRPLPADVDGGQFQNNLTEKVEELKKRSVLEKVELPENFALGFDRYTGGQPSDRAVADLQFHLSAVDFLANALFDAGIDQIDSIERPELAVEGPETTEPEPSGSSSSNRNRRDAEPVQYTNRYPVTLCFTGNSSSFEEFLNRIANTGKDEFVFNVRYLTVRNESEEGPPKGIDFAQAIRDSARENQSADETTTADLGGSTASTDSRVVLGAEKIQACVVVEAVRFADPDAADGEDDSESGDA